MGKKLRYQKCLFAILAIVACRSAVAQDSPDVWVNGIALPQYFAILVEDVDDSMEWYRAALGLRELDGSRADDGSWRIVNVANDRLFVEIIRDDRARDIDRARGFFKVGFQVPDVEVVADRVEQATGERRSRDWPLKCLCSIFTPLAQAGAALVGSILEAHCV